MIHKTLILFIAVLLTGCQALSHKAMTSKEAASFAAAQEAMNSGEYYRARKITEKLIEAEPESRQNELLMAEILEKEISVHKEAFEDKLPVEYDDEERRQMTRTWIERSRQLFQMKEYSEAMLAAETVFKYDAQNLEASELIDTIRRQVYKEGKQDTVYLKGMYRQEIDERRIRYKEQAKQLMEKGLLAEAQLTIDKALLLEPSDREANKIREMIFNRKEA